MSQRYLHPLIVIRSIASLSLISFAVPHILLLQESVMCINMMENILQQLAVDIFGRNRHIGSLSEESEKGKIKIASLLIHTDTQQVFKRVSLCICEGEEER